MSRPDPYDTCAYDTLLYLLYLPAHEGMDEADVERLAQAIAEFEQRHTSQAAGALKMS